MNYYAYEMAHVFMSPLRMSARGLKMSMGLPFNPVSQTAFGKSISAACEVFEGITRRYGCEPRITYFETFAIADQGTRLAGAPMD